MDAVLARRFASSSSPPRIRSNGIPASLPITEDSPRSRSIPMARPSSSSSMCFPLIRLRTVCVCGFALLQRRRSPFQRPDRRGARSRNASDPACAQGRAGAWCRRSESLATICRRRMGPVSATISTSRTWARLTCWRSNTRRWWRIGEPELARGAAPPSKRSWTASSASTESLCLTNWLAARWRSTALFANATRAKEVLGWVAKRDVDEILRSRGSAAEAGSGELPVVLGFDEPDGL